MFEYCPKCKAKIEGNPKFCSECGTPLRKTEIKKMRAFNKKTWIISGMVIVVIVIVFSIVYLLSSGMIQPNNNNNNFYNNSENQTINSSLEPKEWVQKVGIGFGPFTDGENAQNKYTMPYFINSTFARINWIFSGKNDCSFSLVIWKVGSASSSNYTGTIISNESSGTLFT